MSKPRYRVPSMAEIAAIPYSGFVAASTFSGCGGSSLGYRMAGFRVAYASEFVPAARETYAANFPSTFVDDRDIRLVSPAEILDRAGGRIDLLDGSPPCAAFSTAGSRSAGWGDVRPYSDTAQRTDDLFFEFARILRGVRPRAFVAENVSGLVKGAARGLFLEFLAELREAGYRVAARVLDAQWLGVPQVRARLIFVGIRDDLEADPEHPSPLPYRYGFAEAVPIPRNVSGGADPLPEEDLEALSIERFAIGGEWHKTGVGGQSERYFSLMRPALDKPCPTITATTGSLGAAGVAHPTECRKLSVAELKRICSFPDDFVLTGDYERQVERLGRAVPPFMSRAVGLSVRRVLEEATS